MADYKEQRDRDLVLIGYRKEEPSGLVKFIPIAPVSIDHPANKDYAECMAWIAAGNTPDADPDLLNRCKEEKKGDYGVEAGNRIKARIPAWINIGAARIGIAGWGVSHGHTPDQSAAVNILNYADVDAVALIDAQTTPATVNAIDPTTDVNFPT